MSNVDCVGEGPCVGQAIAAIVVSGTDAVAPTRGIDTMTLWSTEEILLEVWSQGWMGIIQNGMTPEAAAEKAFKRVETILAKYPIAEA